MFQSLIQNVDCILMHQLLRFDASLLQEFGIPLKNITFWNPCQPRLG